MRAKRRARRPGVLTDSGHFGSHLAGWAGQSPPARSACASSGGPSRVSGAPPCEAGEVTPLPDVPRSAWPYYHSSVSSSCARYANDSVRGHVPVAPPRARRPRKDRDAPTVQSLLRQFAATRVGAEQLAYTRLELLHQLEQIFLEDNSCLSQALRIGVSTWGSPRGSPAGLRWGWICNSGGNVRQ